MLKFHDIQTFLVSFIFHSILATFWTNKEKVCPNQEGWKILISLTHSFYRRKLFLKKKCISKFILQVDLFGISVLEISSYFHVKFSLAISPTFTFLLKGLYVMGSRYCQAKYIKVDLKCKVMDIYFWN